MVRKLIKSKKINVVVIIGGYIVVLVIVVVKLCNILVIFYEFNFIFGKVIIWLGCWCDIVAIGFWGIVKYLFNCVMVWISIFVWE